MMPDGTRPGNEGRFVGPGLGLRLGGIWPGIEARFVGLGLVPLSSD